MTTPPAGARPAALANKLASAAEDFAEQENWPRAIENYYLAAEQYLLALKDTSDVEAKQTLKLLYNTNLKKAKDLQKRMSAAGPPSLQPPPAKISVPLAELSPANAISTITPAKTPSLPVLVAPFSDTVPMPMPMPMPPTATLPIPQPLALPDGAEGGPVPPFLSQALPPEAPTVAPSKAAARAVSTQMAAATTATPPVNMRPQPPSGQSAQPGDTAASGAEDPLARFWDTVEHLVARLPAFSSPITFNNWHMPVHGWARAPAQNVYPPDADNTEPDRSTVNSNMLNSYYIVPSPVDNNESNPASTNASAINRPLGLADNGIGPEAPTSVSALAQENAVLRQIVTAFEKNSAFLEGENHLLRSNIMQFRNEFQDQARRFRQQELGRSAAPMLRSLAVGEQNSVSASTPALAAFVPGQRPLSEAQHLQVLRERVQLLEREVGQLRNENANLSTKLKRFKERWDELKEGARRRTMATGPSTSTGDISTRPADGASISVSVDHVTQATTAPQPHTSSTLL